MPKLRPTTPDGTVTLTEAALKLGLTKSSVSIFCKKGFLKKIEIDGFVYIEKSVLDNYIFNRKKYTKKQSDEEIDQEYKKVLSLVEGGMPIYKAIKEMGYDSTSRFYKKCGKKRMSLILGIKMANSKTIVNGKKYHKFGTGSKLARYFRPNEAEEVMEDDF